MANETKRFPAETDEERAFRQEFRSNPRDMSDDTQQFARDKFNGVFDWLYGEKETIGKYPEPYDKRFDFIFIDGRNVTDICRRATSGMSVEEATDYKKNVVVDAMQSRDKVVEACVPKRKQDKMDGPLYATGEYSEPMHFDPREDVPQPGGLMGILNAVGRAVLGVLGALGLYKAPETPESRYEEIITRTAGTRLESIKGTVEKSIEQSKNIHRDEIQRGQIQTTLYNEGKNVYGREARLKDGEAFFGGRPIEDFASQNLHGLRTLGGRDYPEAEGAARCGRTSMAQLLMLTKGFSLDEVFAQHEYMFEEKSKVGRELMDILFSNDPQRIGKMYADIDKTIGNITVPYIDIRNDREMVGLFKQSYLYTSCLADFDQSINIGYADKIDESPNEELKPILQAYRDNLAPGEYERLSKQRLALQTFGKIIEGKCTFIGGSDYSDANEYRANVENYVQGTFINIREDKTRESNSWRHNAYMSDKVVDNFAEVFFENAGKTFDESGLSLSAHIFQQTVALGKWNAMSPAEQEYAYDNLLSLDRKPDEIQRGNALGDFDNAPARTAKREAINDADLRNDSGIKETGKTQTAAPAKKEPAKVMGNMQ